MFALFLFISLHFSRSVAVSFNPNFPPHHLSFYYNSFPKQKAECLQSENCENKEFLLSPAYNSTACWGFEKDCGLDNRYHTPVCPGDHTGWVQSKQIQIDTFYYQADFGFVRQQISEMSLLCEPKYLEDSSLECSSFLRFCRGRNLVINFQDLLNRTQPIRYDMDVLKQGQIGGRCKLKKEKLREELDHMGALQSWAPELRYFEELPEHPICDIVVDKPTYIMKIDASYNMYHHFCDFFNLYASLFVNQTHPLAFSQDTRVLIWETYPYDSPFAETFKAFSDTQVWTLNNFKGKVVCFKNLVLPLLPRMIFGLYYNTPLISGCENSGLFQAFAEFILHRLKIPEYPRDGSQKVRITFLIRRTKYRQVLNEEELLEEISKNDKYLVRRVSFERGVSFQEQLQIVRNTDILIGMHGAGLTHLLFLPNWATIFELYNCEDPNCYKDLARLRGVNYVTWENHEKLDQQDEGHHPKGGAHAKFTNYAFDKEEFARLVNISAENVLKNLEFQKYSKSRHIEISKTSPNKDEL